MVNNFDNFIFRIKYPKRAQKKQKKNLSLMPKTKPNKGPKNKPKVPKRKWPELNSEVTLPFHNLALIHHIFLVSTSIYELFKTLNSLLLKLQKHMLLIS